MSPRYLRNEPGREENASAALISAAVALGLGVVIFYFARMFLAREPVTDNGGEEATGVVKADP